MLILISLITQMAEQPIELVQTRNDVSKRKPDVQLHGTCKFKYLATTAEWQWVRCRH